MLPASSCAVRISEPVLKVIVSKSNKHLEIITYADSPDKKVGISCVKDGTFLQVMDICYAKENRKDAVLIDIHGGFHVTGKRDNNRPFASFFLKEDFDVVLVEYRVNDGSTCVC